MGIAPPAVAHICSNDANMDFFCRHDGTEVSFDVNNLMIPGKGIRGILEGESVPDIFIPQLIKLNAQGRFPFEKLTKFYSLDQINQAAKDSENGGTIKPIIRLM